jgi:hypothetical protein
MSSIREAANNAAGLDVKCKQMKCLDIMALCDFFRSGTPDDVGPEGKE